MYVYVVTVFFESHNVIVRSEKIWHLFTYVSEIET